MTIHAEARGLLFDMDGVLISSIAAVRRCWREWCRRHQLPGLETYDIPHGTRAIEIVAMLCPEIDPAEGLREIEDLELADMDGLTVLPGAAELLRSLPAERWAIVTSATRPLLMARLKHAGLPVPERIVAGEDVSRGKPAPDPYRAGAAMLAVPPGDCIVFEDAPAGITSGLAAGCRVVGVAGTHTADQIAVATWTVPSLAAVRAELQGQCIHLAWE